MPTIVCTLALAVLTACTDDPEPCGAAPIPAQLVASYDCQWEYQLPYTAYAASFWQSVWPSLGFTRSYDELRPRIPDGLRTILYHDGDAVDVRNIPPHGGTVYVNGLEPSMLVFNNDIEYDLINGQSDVQEASVSTRMIERPSYDGSPYARDASMLTTMPDVIFHCYLPEIEIASIMDEIRLKAYMMPLVYTYAVRFFFSKGIDYVAIARGALAGMARGAWLWDGDPFEQRVSVGFDADIANGGLEAYVTSFGHPNSYPVATYGVNLEVRLKNGKRLAYDFDITDQMRRQPRGGVIIVRDIEIPDSVGEQPSGGGFDVTIDNWGQFEDIPIQL